MLTSSWLQMLFAAIKCIGFVLTIRTKAILNVGLFLTANIIRGHQEYRLCLDYEPRQFLMLASSWLLMLFEAIKSVGFVLTSNQGNFECLCCREAIKSIGFVLTRNQGNFECWPPVDRWGLCEAILIFGLLLAAEIYSRSFQVLASYHLLRCIRGFIKWQSPYACWGLFKNIWMLTSSWLLMLSFILTPNLGNFEYWPLLNCWGYVRILWYLLLRIINSRSVSN